MTVGTMPVGTMPVGTMPVGTMPVDALLPTRKSFFFFLNGLLVIVYALLFSTADAGVSHKKVDLNEGISLSQFVSMDGRLQFSVGQQASVRVFRPENVKKNSQGFPVLEPTNFSNKVYLFKPRDGFGINSISACSKDWNTTPYKCDGNNQPTDNGAYECYELNLFYTDQCNQKALCGNLPNLIIKRQALFLRVDNPRTENAGVAEANLIGLPQEIKSVGPGPEENYTVKGIEISLTKDGKLLTYAMPREVLYSVLPNGTEACALDGWSEQKSVADMHKDPVAKARYLFAQRPITDPAGKPLEYLRGAYPWIFPSGDNIMFNGRKKNCSTTPIRSQASIVGSSTNWTTQLIEGAVNPNRGIRTYPGTGFECRETFFQTSGALFSLQNIPGTQSQETWAFFQNAPKFSYTEVSLDDSVDEGIVAAWHMNEFVLRGENIFENEEASDYPGNYFITPDNSGHYHSGELFGGANIPDVNLGPTGRVTAFNGGNSRMSVISEKIYGDITHAYHRSNREDNLGYAEFDTNKPPESQFRINKGLPELNENGYLGIEILFNLTSLPGKDIDLVTLAGSSYCQNGLTFQVALTQEGQLKASICKTGVLNSTDLTTEISQLPTPLTQLLGQWHAVFVKYNIKKDILQVYVSGVLVAEQQGDQIGSLVSTKGRTLRVAGNGFTGLVDELALYKRNVLEREICFKAGRRDCETPLPMTGLTFNAQSGKIKFEAVYPSNSSVKMKVEAESFQFKINGLDFTQELANLVESQSAIYNGRGIEIVFDVSSLQNVFPLEKIDYFSIEMTDVLGNKLFRSGDLKEEVLTFSEVPGIYYEPVKLEKELPACDSDIAQIGEDLFLNQTFSGNGVTCATCHKVQDDFALTQRGVIEERALGTKSKLYQAVKDFPSGVDIALQCGLVPVKVTLPENIELKNEPDVREVVVFRAVPSILNSVYTAVYNHDGRFSDLQEQAIGAVDAHFGENQGITDEQLLALQVYESCQTGDLVPIRDNIPSAGMDLFFGKARCAECHGGDQLSLHDHAPASTFRTDAPDSNNCDQLIDEKVYLIYPISGDKNFPIELASRDPGRALVTGNPMDWEKFDVPQLHKINNTAPYFHNNSKADLPALVDHYNDQLHLNLSTAEKSDLIQFLESL